MQNQTPVQQQDQDQQQVMSQQQDQTPEARLKDPQSRYNILMQEGQRTQQTKERKGWFKGKDKELDKFNYAEAVAVAEQSLKRSIFRRMFSRKKARFGDDKIHDYNVKLKTMEYTIWYCRQKGWHTRDDWQKHGVPINRMFNELNLAMLEYAEVLRFYKTKENLAKSRGLDGKKER